MTWKPVIGIVAISWLVAVLVWQIGEEYHVPYADFLGVFSFFVWQGVTTIGYLAIEAVTELKAIRALLEAKHLAEKSN